MPSDVFRVYEGNKLACHDNRNTPHYTSVLRFCMLAMEEKTGKQNWTWSAVVGVASPRTKLQGVIGNGTCFMLRLSCLSMTVRTGKLKAGNKLVNEHQKMDSEGRARSGSELLSALSVLPTRCRMEAAAASIRHVPAVLFSTSLYTSVHHARAHTAICLGAWGLSLTYYSLLALSVYD